MKLSIITVNLNNAEGLKNTIDSVINQPFKDIEYIVIDGGSTDGSFEIIKQNEKFLTYYVSEPDNGIFQAMNKGIKVANGEYLLFLNSGYWLEENVLSKIADEFGKAEIIYGDLNSISKQGKISKYVLPSKWTLMTFRGNSIPHPAAFIHRNLFKDYLYNEELQIIGDWEFFIRKIIFEDVSYRHLNLVVSNMPTGGISSNPKFHKNKELEGTKVLNELLPKAIVEDYDQFVKIRSYLPVYETLMVIKNRRIASLFFYFNKFIAKPILNFFEK